MFHVFYMKTNTDYKVSTSAYQPSATQEIQNYYNWLQEQYGLLSLA